MTTRVPNGTPDATVEDNRTGEAARSRELAAAGHLLRLWRPPLDEERKSDAMSPSARAMGYNEATARRSKGKGGILWTTTQRR
jgi:hypothetical protein